MSKYEVMLWATINAEDKAMAEAVADEAAVNLLENAAGFVESVGIISVEEQ